MDSNLNKKLLLVGFIVVLIIVGGLGWVMAMRYYEGQKIPLPMDISEAAVRAKCLEDVGRMDDEQIVEKINTLAFATEEDLKKLNNLMLKHLQCQFFENPFEERFKETESLIGMIKSNEQNKILWIEDLSKYLKAAQENREGIVRMISRFSFPLIGYTKERICPDGKEDQDIVGKWTEAAVESGYSGVALDKVKNVINNYCGQIIKYSEDELSLAKEVYEFKDWVNDPMERGFETKWRIILSFRFGDETKALGVCNNLVNLAEKKDCLDLVDKISNGWFIRTVRAEGCTGYELKEARDLICQYRSQ